MKIFCILLLCLFFAACRTPHTVVVTLRDTVRSSTSLRDTVTLRDTVRERFTQSGDTVWAVREVTRWRERVSHVTDTVRLTAVRDTVTVCGPVRERPAPADKKGWWLLAGALAVAGVWLFYKSQKSKVKSHF